LCIPQINRKILLQQQVLPALKSALLLTVKSSSAASAPAALSFESSPTEASTIAECLAALRLVISNRESSDSRDPETQQVIDVFVQEDRLLLRTIFSLCSFAEHGTASTVESNGQSQTSPSDEGDPTGPINPAVFTVRTKAKWLVAAIATNAFAQYDADHMVSVESALPSVILACLT
jgi:hypothetical protein